MLKIIEKMVKKFDFLSDISFHFIRFNSFFFNRISYQTIRHAQFIKNCSSIDTTLK